MPGWIYLVAEWPLTPSTEPYALPTHLIILETKLAGQMASKKKKPTDTQRAQSRRPRRTKIKIRLLSIYASLMKTVFAFTQNNFTMNMFYQFGCKNAGLPLYHHPSCFSGPVLPLSGLLFVCALSVSWVSGCSKTLKQHRNVATTGTRFDFFHQHSKTKVQRKVWQVRCFYVQQMVVVYSMIPALHVILFLHIPSSKQQYDYLVISSLLSLIRITQNGSV